MSTERSVPRSDEIVNFWRAEFSSIHSSFQNHMRKGQDLFQVAPKLLIGGWTVLVRWSLRLSSLHNDHLSRKSHLIGGKEFLNRSLDFTGDL